MPVSIERHSHLAAGFSGHRQLLVVFAAAAFIGLLALASDASAAQPLSDHASQVPSTQHLGHAHRAYSSGNYGAALRRFEKAAFWADKLAQYNIGVMHYHGQGVEQDAARAWAWLALSAERDYELMVTLANQVWRELEPVERQRALAILNEEIAPAYGDEVAIPRTARHMDQQFRMATGSRLGFTSTQLSVQLIKGSAQYNPYTNQLSYSSESHVGPDFYEPRLWDFDQVLKGESWLFNEGARGSVLLRDLELDDDGPDRER